MFVGGPDKLPYICTQISRDFAQTNGSVCSYTRLVVIRSLRKVLEKLPIDCAIGKFGDDRQHAFDSLFSYYRGDIRETRNLLRISICVQVKLGIAYHLWEDLLVHDFLR